MESRDLKTTRQPSLAERLDQHIADALIDMAAKGIEWSSKRQGEYNAACIKFAKACEARDQAGMDAASAIARRMEAEGGIL